MQRACRLAVPIVLAALGLACAKPVVDVDPDEDFSVYETWEWLPRRAALGAVAQLRPELHERVVAQVERELRERGYRRADGEPPDFFVTYHLKLQRQLVVRSETPAEEVLETFHEGGFYGVTRTVTHVAHYEQATLAIDVSEGHDRQLVWRGQLSERVRGSFDRRASGGVADIMESFPRRQGTER